MIEVMLDVFLLTRREQVVLSLVLIAFVSGVSIRHFQLMSLIPAEKKIHSLSR